MKGYGKSGGKDCSHYHPSKDNGTKGSAVKMPNTKPKGYGGMKNSTNLRKQPK